MSEDEIQKVEDTCIHGCYYVDTDQECNIDKQYCKREVEFVRKQLLASGQFISVAELKEEIEKKLRVLITHKVSKCTRCQSYNNALDDLLALLDEMVKAGHD